MFEEFNKIEKPVEEKPQPSIETKPKEKPKNPLCKSIYC